MERQLKNAYHFFIAFLAAIYFRFPAKKLTVIGITGTSGKTTTTHMVYAVLEDAGYKVSVLSTIKAVLGGTEYDTGFHVTTPNAWALQKYLREAVNKGDTHFVLEVSSHALDQNRVAFITFAIGVLTSLAHEHLDYHKTMEKYAKAKFILLHRARIAVLPAENIAPALLAVVNAAAIKHTVTFGLTHGDERQIAWNLTIPMPGDFNLLDALAAASVGKLLGISQKDIKKTLQKFTGIPGRFEEIATNSNFRIIIDFAHKPNALEGLLQTARTQITGTGRVIVLYGCASERDVLKRPIMGALSGRLADITILTDEDPRFEEPMKILTEIAVGCIRANAHKQEVGDTTASKRHIFFTIPHRMQAIEFAIIRLARKGDIILLCGKGHEKSINYQGVETPWSEHAAVTEALKKRIKKS